MRRFSSRIWLAVASAGRPATTSTSATTVTTSRPKCPRIRLPPSAEPHARRRDDQVNDRAGAQLACSPVPTIPHRRARR